MNLSSLSFVLPPTVRPAETRPYSNLSCKFSGEEDIFRIKQRNSLKQVLADPDAAVRLWLFIARGPFKQIDPKSTNAKVDQLFLYMKTLLTDSRLTENQVIEHIHRYLRTTLYPGIKFEQSGKMQANRTTSTSKEVTDSLLKVTPYHWKPQAFMDLGCGNGSVAASVGKHYGLAPKNIIAADISPPPYAPQQYTALKADGSSISNVLPEQSLDLITLLAVLHHTSNPEKVLEECYKLLKPGGYLLLREHDYPKESQIDRELQHVVETFYSLVYPDTPQPHMDCPENYNSKEQWTQIFTKLGYQLKRIDPVTNHPLKPFYAILQKPID